MTNGPCQFSLATHPLDGDMLTSFDNHSKTLGLTETQCNVQNCLDAVLTDIFPHHEVLNQKCYVQRAMHEPQNAKTLVSG